MPFGTCRLSKVCAGGTQPSDFVSVYSAGQEDDRTFIFSLIDPYLGDTAKVRYEYDPQPLLNNMVKVSMCHMTIT